MGRRSMVVFVALMTIAGCGDSGEPKVETSFPAPPRTPSAGASVKATATAGALPAAADGTRLSACHQRKCEVLVSPRDEISLPARLGVKTVIVKAPYDDRPYGAPAEQADTVSAATSRTAQTYPEGTGLGAWHHRYRTNLFAYGRGRRTHASP
jgi:hypothetical protein